MIEIVDGSVMQWDRVENKTAVAVYGVGAVVLLWFSSTIVSAVNSVPLVRNFRTDLRSLVPKTQAGILLISNANVCLQVPKLLELVGLGYTSWFVYRYLLFKVSLRPRTDSICCNSVGQIPK